MMGGDSLVRIFLTNLTSVTEKQAPVSLRKSFSQPRFFQRHYVAVWSLKETVDLNFAQFSSSLTEVDQAGLCGFSKYLFLVAVFVFRQVSPMKLLELFGNRT